ncbi:sensor histidine kinase [Rhizobacter sp. LjRoot28]|uniref:sensor histidine kinase n=1 Tax=Rhizobacter sp. LjRoot28 TaxID=3342309 RepID=UPI003ECF32AF
MGREAATIDRAVTSSATLDPMSHWPMATLEALDICAASLAPSSGRVLWRAPAFDDLVGGAHDTIEALCGALPGLQVLLDDLDDDLVRPLDCGGRMLEAQLTRRGGVTVLRLADRVAEAQARQRHLEDRERLLFTSRLLSIGEMATTLAHEINQPIGAAANLLRGAVMRLQRQQGASATAEQASLLQALQRATEQVLFASRVIARIREYTHSHTPQRVPVDVVALLKVCVSLLDWECEREGVDVKVEVPGTPLWTMADEVMLQQLFVNLMRNAIDAMRGCPPGCKALVIDARPEGPQLEVTVRDSGCGISEAAEQTLFVPFVSSKPTGTGIGLNICRSFVELHQGRLWFTRNEDGPGTSFHAALPLLPPADIQKLQEESKR